MTFHLFHADKNSLLASDRAVIKRSDRKDFTDAAALLQAASAIRDEAVAATEAARREGHAQGLAEARDTIEAQLAEQIAGFAAALDGHEQARRSDIAEAAYAAVRAIVGEIADEELVPRMVERTLARLPAEGPVALFVAEALATKVSERLGTASHVVVSAEPGLGPTDCVVRTSAGQVIASLSVQLDSLAKRWGVAA
ncbi:FliH/SctL family protein [Sphingosinicella sp. BN140058]|uniref:FliH/SctL family protein n=1 Tax=Sphingosinicella sp. BN140058 TaxID=1892855 RepID=UPI0013EA71DE|nr:FliH/SctL family protein [Sphingosinicella sp. BN140058]